MRTLLALVFCALAGAAHAQQGNCAAQWSRASDLLERFARVELPSLGIIRETSDGGCRTDGVSIPFGNNFEVSIDRMLWRGDGLEKFATEGLSPTALTVSVTGLGIVTRIGDPVFDYLQSIRSSASEIDAAVSMEWDVDTRVLELKSARIDLPQQDFVEAQARIEGVDLSSAQSIQMSAGSFALTSQKLTIRSQSMFQDYLLVPLGMALLDGAENPAARIDELKAEASRAIDDMPSMIVSADGKSALKALVADMPEPVGTLVVEQTADPGFGPARAMPFVTGRQRLDDLSDYMSLLEGVEISVTYDKF